MVMEIIPVFESREAVVEKINNHEVDELLQYDWEKITAGFKAECLQSIVLSICDDDARLAVVRVCLTQYKYYLLRTNYDLFQLTWETCNPFRVLCEAMLCDFEATDKFRIARECPTLVSRDSEVDMGVFESDQAKRLLKRVEARFFSGGRWNEEVSKAVKSQVAHVMSVLLGIPKNRKWTYFERLWDETGLAKAFFARYSRPLDAEVRELFPEYPSRY